MRRKSSSKDGWRSYTGLEEGEGAPKPGGPGWGDPATSTKGPTVGGAEVPGRREQLVGPGGRQVGLARQVYVATMLSGRPEAKDVTSRQMVSRPGAACSRQQVGDSERRQQEAVDAY
ncbi:hypothetical protein MRX96_001630 [Rhipicephalus microplus]